MPTTPTSARGGARERCRRRTLSLAAAFALLVLLVAAAAGESAFAGHAASPAFAAHGAAKTAAPAARTSAPPYRIYFGDLHAHTAFSDGKGTPEKAYAQAARGGADFLALTDHREGLTAAEWARTQSAAAAATTGTFVGLPAFEVKPATGHLNIYDTAELPPIGLDAPALYDWIAAQGAIGEWNHPTRSSKDFAGYAYRTATRDAAIGLIEVVNHGSIPLDPDYERSYRRALDKGWHVMPAANGDIHDASWITGNDERTVLLATGLTPEALYEAMRARRGYATRLHGLLVDYTVGGAVMGTIIPARTGKLKIAVRVRGRDAAKGLTISKLDVVSNSGRLVASSSRDGKALDWTTSVAVRPGRYYYLRVWGKVLFLDVKMAWTAPVWVGAAPGSDRR